MKAMDGGCSIPVFGLATLAGDQIQLKGGIISLDGKKVIRKTIAGPKEKATALGQKLAVEVLTNGGAEILESIKNQPI